MKQLEDIKEEDLIFYDIETIRGEKVFSKESPMYEAWKYKTRYQNEINKKTGSQFTEEEYYYEKAPLYAPFSKIVSIVVGRVKDGVIYIVPYASENEKDLLEAFNSDLQKVYSANPRVRLMGFNSNGFDSPFILKRSLVNGVKPARPIDEGTSKAWELKALDLSKIWQGTSFYPDSLVAVAAAFGLPSPKDALDGSMVSQAFYEGRLEEIVKYCIKDVETTTRLFRKMALREDYDDLVIVSKVRPNDIDTTVKIKTEVKKIVRVKKEEEKLALKPVKAKKEEVKTVEPKAAPDTREPEDILFGKLPVLHKILNATEMSEETKEELTAVLKKKKPTKKDKIILEDILVNLYVNNTMFKSDKAEVQASKRAEIVEILNKL